MRGGMQIPSGADMDEYITPGNYYCGGNNTVQTLANCPFTHAFTLKVQFGNGEGYSSQTFHEFDTGRIAWRWRNTNLQWSDWVYFSDDATVLTSVQVDSLQTSNKSVVSAINEIGGDATQSDVMAVFNEIKNNLWATWDVGFINTALSISGPTLYALHSGIPFLYYIY